MLFNIIIQHYDIYASVCILKVMLHLPCLFFAHKCYTMTLHVMLIHSFKCFAFQMKKIMYKKGPSRLSVIQFN